MAGHRRRALSRGEQRTFLAILVAVWVLLFAASHHVAGEHRDRLAMDLEPQSGPAPITAAVGYSGDATLRGFPSPEWSRGVATAWRIDKRLGWSFPEYDADMEVDGDRLYVAFKASIRAYDISGPQPVLLWKQTPPHYGNVSGIQVWGDRLLIDMTLYDADTGERISSLPREEQGEDAWLIDSVLVACGEHGSECWGLDENLNRLWTSEWLGRPLDYRLETTRGKDHSWFSFVSEGYAKSHAIVDVRTGTAQRIDLGFGLDSYIRPVADGWILEDPSEKVVMTADADGTPRQAFNLPRDHPANFALPIVGADGGTIEQWERYYANRDASWALGVLTASGDQCQTLHEGDSSVRLESNRARSAYRRERIDSADVYCRVLRPSRASEDASVLFYPERRHQVPGGRPEEVRRFHFVAMRASHLVRLDRSQDVRAGVWAYDDLYIGMTPSGIVALTPRRG